jgi:hypothetical protein
LPSNTNTSIGSFTKLRNKALKLYFTSGKVKLATAAVKERYVRWQLSRLLEKPNSVSRPSVPVRKDIVLSLTSWQKRLDVLPLALYCLVHQSVWPARFEVWLTEEDIARLPDNVRTLFENFGVQFRPTEDYRSHKKWLPAIREHTDRYIVTADDDTLYPRHWLKWLLRDFTPGTDVSVGHVCKKITFDSEGNIRPYDEWIKGRDVPPRVVSRSLFATGYGGQILHRKWFGDQFLEPELIFDLCPKNDDIWLVFALRMGGIRTRNSSVYLPLMEVAGNYETSLQRFNLAQGQNDEQIRRTLEAFDLSPSFFRDEHTTIPQ